MRSHNPYPWNPTFYQLFSLNGTWPITVPASSAPIQCPPYISLKAPLHIHHLLQLWDEVLVRGLHCSKLHYYIKACQPFYTEKVMSSIGLLAQLFEHWVFHYAMCYIFALLYFYSTFFPPWLLNSLTSRTHGYTHSHYHDLFPYWLLIDSIIIYDSYRLWLIAYLYKPVVTICVW